ncbi:hypothetical protein DKK70_04325 [Gilliamella apicola]|uniref:Uncharacterized protein n=1 Tax=Gilliamella apicola TaxID=1196095 RepID=A0A2V4E3T0_9GAMM|nr:hypothetical protein [Gilliamella apicola]PXZ07890.1 hypothetical protein DKK70_04325 [Gilliamella apicola]
MFIFRIMSISLGAALTIASIYEAQKILEKKCHIKNLTQSQNIAIRSATGFAVSVVIGGAVINTIKKIYKY